ncbi:MAG: hypothetical protein ACJAS1_006856, partial [Oleiphilaceae bacterium]
FTSGINLLAQYGADCLGEVCETYKVPEHNPVVLRFFSFDSGYVTSVDGWEKIANHSRVLASDLFIKKGDTISPITSDANRHGFFILEGCSKDAELLFKSLRIHYA